VRHALALHFVHSPSAVNGRDKVVSLKELEPSGIRQKVQLLLDSSGAKIKPLKSRPLESTTESVRGIWSGLHAPRPTL
jgi:large subunit ribosomal protein L43